MALVCANCECVFFLLTWARANITTNHLQPCRSRSHKHHTTPPASPSTRRTLGMAATTQSTGRARPTTPRLPPGIAAPPLPLLLRQRGRSSVPPLLILSIRLVRPSSTTPVVASLEAAHQRILATARTSRSPTTPQVTMTRVIPASPRAPVSAYARRRPPVLLRLPRMTPRSLSTALAASKILLI